MFYQDPFDVIIIGGVMQAPRPQWPRMGQQTLLLTHNIDTLGQMSCNPAIGGWEGTPGKKKWMRLVG